MDSAVLLIFGMLVRNRSKNCQYLIKCNIFVFCEDNTLLLKLLFVFYVLMFIQIKYIFLRVSYYLKIKSFTFSCLLYYYLRV